MSYEGYTQNLCINGHYFDSGEGNYNAIGPCPECRGDPVWTNHVDETNCESYGVIRMEQFLVTPAQVAKCNLGHEHELTPAVYRRPTGDEAHKARYWRPDGGESRWVQIYTGS